MRKYLARGQDIWTDVQTNTWTDIQTIFFHFQFFGNKIGSYTFFRPYHLDTYGPHTDLFSYGFPRKLHAGPFGSYDNVLSGITQ